MERATGVILRHGAGCALYRDDHPKNRMSICSFLILFLLQGRRLRHPELECSLQQQVIKVEWVAVVSTKPLLSIATYSNFCRLPYLHAASSIAVVWTHFLISCASITSACPLLDDVVDLLIDGRWTEAIVQDTIGPAAYWRDPFK